MQSPFEEFSKVAEDSLGGVRELKDESFDAYLDIQVVSRSLNPGMNLWEN